MNPISANISALRNIVNFKSCASRSEYWWVFATLIGGVILAAIIDEQFFAGGGKDSALYSGLNLLFILFMCRGCWLLFPSRYGGYTIWI